MKLIDLLVQELPKRGGWPDGSTRCMQTDGMYVTFPDIGDHCDFVAKCMADGVRIATRDQYEAALAASKTPAWNGEGLPPVGAECEIKRMADWMPVTIKFISERHTIFTTLGGTEDCYQTCSLQFRPIRTEAERKRDVFCRELVRYLDRECDANNPFCENDVAGFYEAIAAGNIPGVKLEAPDA